MDRRTRETSREYASPYRPLPLRLYNALGRVKPFDLERSIAAAKRNSGLSEFATQSFREPLTRLIESLHETANLSPMGRFMTAQHFASGLTNNLRAGALFAARPELLELELARPIMICGLPRSGTTLLQRMFAQLPGARAVATYEVYEPFSEPGWAKSDTKLDPRIGRARKAESFLRWLSPDLFAVHPMSAEAPEEEALVIENVFQSGVPESTYNVPSYAAWLAQQDQTPAYRWLANCMRALQWQRPGQFWVLKSPHHLEWLDTVFEVFPDITIIQTHRDPVETVPSYCSLVGHGWGIMSDVVDPHVIGAHWSTKIDRMLTRGLATRDARDGQGFVDVDYRELAADPLGVMAKLCENLNLTWNDEVRAKLEVWLGEHPRHEHGIHRYAAEDFGLTTDELAARSKVYRERFDLIS